MSTDYQQFTQTRLSLRSAPQLRIGRTSGDILQYLYREIAANISQFPNAVSNGRVTYTGTSPSFSAPSAAQPLISSVPTGVKASFQKYKYATHTFEMSIANRLVHLSVAVRQSAKRTLTYITEKFTKRVFALCKLLLGQATNEHCTSKLVIFIIATECRKTFPDLKNDIITAENANTAFTYGCDPMTRRSETPIIVFREEEWFKVLAHELCHATGIDFSELHNDRIVNDIVNTKMKASFNIKSVHIKLYETYCETWATIINALFFVFYETGGRDDRNIPTYISAALTNEIKWSSFQLSKLLRKYDTDYLTLTESVASRDVAESIDEHDVAVFSYNVAKTVTMLHVGEFIEWCAEHSNTDSVIQFTNDYATVQSFCEFIRKRHCAPDLLHYVSDIQKNLDNYESVPMNTMRMSVNEF